MKLSPTNMYPIAAEQEGHTFSRNCVLHRVKPHKDDPFTDGGYSVESAGFTIQMQQWSKEDLISTRIICFLHML